MATRGTAWWIGWFLVATAMLPAPAQAQEAPSNPLVKQVLLFPTATGILASVIPANASFVTAGASNIDGTSTPVSWTTEASKNSTLAGSPFVAVTVFADKPTVVAGGPDGNSIKFELTQNGKPLPSAVAFAKLSTGVLQQNSSERVSAVFPVINTTIKPGDKLGIEISFYGLNPEAAPTVKYKVGGDSNTRLVFIIHLASLAEVELPPEVGPWDIRPLEGFDFREAKKKDATVTEVTLQAFQFGFQGAPVVVANGSKVVLHLYVDESFSASQEGHGAHAHGAPASGGGEHAGHVAWDQVTMAALHGFNLASLDPKLHTVLFDSLVVTMNLTADRPGNYTFMCTVFCGSGHGTMLDRLTIQGPPAPAESSGPPALAPPTAKTPALAVGGMLVALLVAAVAYPRQGRR